ncbi:hypothetical protein EYF80_044234 [Liparis tanakae]|uniref:Uncharacterized protein n=1 Tax=Liparis tanakae TaxID=230148 RepID=A0A4Z2FWE6_9TELE|nr:hypothetical protein EYF80_044234 [Liparis tanakae]
MTSGGGAVGGSIPDPCAVYMSKCPWLRGKTARGGVAPAAPDQRGAPLAEDYASGSYLLTSSLQVILSSSDDGHPLTGFVRFDH